MYVCMSLKAVPVSFEVNAWSYFLLKFELSESLSAAGIIVFIFYLNFILSVESD